MSTVAVIPSRYASSRLEGKALVDLAGKPMVQRVYEVALRTHLVDRVIVATDDKRILDAVQGFGGEAELTSPQHVSGTDRIAEVVDHLSCDVVVNLQGDEPLMDPRLIDDVVKLLLDDQDVSMASAQSPIDTIEDLMNPNIVKVVSDRNGYALYFSRSPIPSRFRNLEDAGDSFGFKHIGLYVYRKDFLKKVVNLGPSPLEKQERLEQLRVLENGYRIKLVTTKFDSIGVDTPEDLTLARKRIEQLEGQKDIR
jgi:3-deoxy-manno-octulosonate cytidylyltransferase (CMP-KDO synthetase)